ncbi:MAG TPA: sigma 54-interacting transcriptional regulator [Gemmatimonadales bacterium]|nr:sigma 54-interacting transcriptional regulator [Gemmatimonadales bacterium]
MRRDPVPTGPSALAPLTAGIVAAWLDASDDGAVAVDAAGRVVLHNPAASRVTGLAPDAAMHRPWRDVVRLEPAMAALLWGARESGTRTHAVGDVLCAQGNLRTAEMSATPWRDGAGGIGVLLLIRDLAILCRQQVAAGGRPGYGALVGEHPSMRALYQLVEAVAPSDAPVLIEGERGTGKELFAQLLHARSRRAERPLITIACPALGAPALERELFGQVRGGPAGAVGTTIGRIELAHTGTLFLDEVGGLPPALQARICRVLETGEMQRAGDPTPRRVDLRIIAASSRPLEREVEAGRFREDLYTRLRVVRLAVPPLRERRSDIGLLAEHLLARYGAPGQTIPPETLALLQARPWPGNVRELDRVIRQAIASLEGRPGAVLSPDRLPPASRSVAPAAPAAEAAGPRDRDDRRALLLRALSSHGGNRTAAARALGIGRATFYRWWRDAGLASAAPASPPAL